MDGDETAWLDAEEWSAWRIVSAMRTQWQRGFDGAPLGLRYEALPVVCGALGETLDEGVLECVQIMEVRMLSEWIRRRDAT